MTITQQDFIRKYNIDMEAYIKSGISWQELEVIYNDFDKKYNDNDLIAKFVAECFRNNEKVHSVRYRVKNPEHLIEKIIRKRLKSPELKITVDNYEQEIHDLIGIRVLHLFKEDWEPIHSYIMEHWTSPQEQPEANVRSGDSDNFLNTFKEKGCKIVVHPFGYRSVHYLIYSTMVKNPKIVEIQVRTIFEEAWSEIDHHIRYPYQVNNKVISNYLEIFNRLAGSSDEMGSFIRFLNNHLRDIETKYTEEIGEKNRIIADLKTRIKKLEIESDEKRDIVRTLDTLDSTVGNALKVYESMYNYDIKTTLNSAVAAINSMSHDELTVRLHDVIEAISDMDKDEIKEIIMNSFDVLNKGQLEVGHVNKIIEVEAEEINEKKSN